MDDRSDEDDDLALERITKSENIEDQVDREILRYWNNRVANEKGSAQKIVKRFRLSIYKALRRTVRKREAI